MKPGTFTSSPIDHYIQADIVRKLYADKECSFSLLKPRDIENSLFMYHIRKLEDRGLLQRTENGYALTLKGTRWVNFVGPTTLQPKMLPRLLINLLITNSDGTRVLLSRRKGQAAEHLNEFLLPGGLYPYGQDVHASAKKTLTSIGLDPRLPATYLCMLEIINTLEDDFMYHSVSACFAVRTEELVVSGSEFYEQEWADIERVYASANEYGVLLPKVLRILTSTEIGPFETLVIEH